MAHKQNVLERLSEAKIMVLGFILVICAGAFLLMLPISSKDWVYTDFLTAIFTSTSATSFGNSRALRSRNFVIGNFFSSSLVLASNAYMGNYNIFHQIMEYICWKLFFAGLPAAHIFYISANSSYIKPDITKVFEFFLCISSNNVVYYD